MRWLGPFFCFGVRWNPGVCGKGKRRKRCEKGGFQFSTQQGSVPLTMRPLSDPGLSSVISGGWKCRWTGPCARGAVEVRWRAGLGLGEM